MENPRPSIKDFAYALLSVTGLALLTGCASAPSTPKGSQCYVDETVVAQTMQEAEAGSSEAQIKVANWYKGGGCLPQDYSKAIEWLLIPAEQGNVGAQSRLGHMYRYFVRNIDNSEKWYRKAADQGDVEAHYSLARLYRYDLNDLDTAIVWYQKAAELGHSQSARTLGEIYTNGDGVEINITKGINWYKKAADTGDNWSARKLGDIYSSNQDFSYYGVAINIDEAVKWYSLGAEQGDSDSAKRLKKLLKENFPEKWINKQLKLADAGDLDTQINLGIAYLHGEYESIVVQIDKQESEKWLQRASEQGGVDAQLKIARIYMDKMKDTPSAIEWYKKAAQQGNISATRKLGDIYWDGEGIEKDIGKAEKWYSVAAEKGDSFSKRRLDPVAWERETCEVEGDGSNEKVVFEPFTPEAYGVEGPEPRVDERYSDNWPRRGKIDDIEQRIQGKYPCRLTRVLLPYEKTPSCSYLTIHRPSKKELEITLFDSDKEGQEKEVYKKILTENKDYAVKKYAIKMKLKPQNDASSKKTPKLTNYLTLTTNNCLVAKTTVTDWEWNPEGVAYTAPLLGPVALIFLAPGQVGSAHWSLIERIED